MIDDDQALVDYAPASHYDRVTGAWSLLLGRDLHYGVFDTGDETLDAATAALTQRMIAAARLEAGMGLLDVGCGTGGPARTAARTAGVTVLGISTSRVGVEDATERSQDAGLAQTRFEVRDALDSDLDDESFDRVWALESSHLMRDRTRLVQECARIVRPGGRIVICDLIRKREIPFLEVRRRHRDFATLRTAFGDAHFGELRDYETDLAAAGVDVDTCDDLTAATYATFERWRANYECHREEITAALGEDGAGAFRESIDILSAFWRDGTFGYGLIAGTKQHPHQREERN